MVYCYDACIALAEEAERMAAEVKDEEHKATWLRIAVGYRDLARMAEIPFPERDWFAPTQDGKNKISRMGSQRKVSYRDSLSLTLHSCSRPCTGDAIAGK